MNNLINEEDLLLERPNLQEECHIVNDSDLDNYIRLYNIYNRFLIQYIMKRFWLIDIDKEMEKHNGEFIEVPYDEKDLYQKSASGYLKYLYLRNNLYIERLTNEEKEYLIKLQNQNIDNIDENIEKFIEQTYLKVILENPKENNVFTNYGPNNKKFMAPTNAIVIGIRVEEFESLSGNNMELYMKIISDLQMTKKFLETKVERTFNIPFSVLKYDEYSVKCKKKMNEIGRK